MIKYKLFDAFILCPSKLLKRFILMTISTIIWLSKNDHKKSRGLENSFQVSPFHFLMALSSNAIQAIEKKTTKNQQQKTYISPFGEYPDLLATSSYRKEDFVKVWWRSNNFYTSFVKNRSSERHTDTPSYCWSNHFQSTNDDHNSIVKITISTTGLGSSQNQEGPDFLSRVNRISKFLKISKKLSIDSRMLLANLVN